MAEILICPNCRHEIRENRTCAHCGYILDKGDWPPIVADSDLSPWTSAHLIAPHKIDEAWGLMPARSFAARAAASVLPRPYEFVTGKSCVRLGAASHGIDIVIEGAEPLHAALIKNQRTQGWWLYDCAGVGGVEVNDQRVHALALKPDDRLTIAGASFVFRGDRLEAPKAPETGLSLAVRHLTVTVPTRTEPILSDINFDVPAGECLGVLGLSGCGKSTLLQQIAGLARPNQGEIRVNGNRLADIAHSLRLVSAYVPQNVDETLHAELTLEEELIAFRRIHLPHESREEMRAANEEILATLGLSGRSSTRIRQMSGGERRRASIALALVRKPKLLLLDEPGAGLDPVSEARLMHHVRGIADQGCTVVCVTHVLSHIECFHRVLVLSAGTIAYHGRPQSLLDAFAVTDFTQLYARLAVGVKGTMRGAGGAVQEAPSAWTLTAARANGREVMGGYLYRAWRAGLGSRARALLLFLWQPLALVVGIRLACAYYFREHIDQQMLGFCAALAVFWVGISQSARVFVRERVPGRCLERLNRVPLAPYVFARFLSTAGVGLLETFVFTLLLNVSALFPVPLVSTTAGASGALSLVWFIPLAFACLMGVFSGLAVSALARTQMSAVSAVPNIAVIALLFSEPVIRFEDGSGLYAAVARFLAVYFMPCHWPMKVIASLSSATPIGAAAWNMVLTLLGYGLVSFGLIFIFQRHHECAWKGR